jgi:hypothetical protein
LCKAKAVKIYWICPRIATEQYSEDPSKIGDCCIHVCNYAVNKKNTEKFVYNTEPDSCKGNKVSRVLEKYSVP